MLNRPPAVTAAIVASQLKVWPLNLHVDAISQDVLKQIFKKKQTNRFVLFGANISDILESFIICSKLNVRKISVIQIPGPDEWQVPATQSHHKTGQ